MGLMPRSIGYQDLVALMARQSEVSQRARAHMMASPFGTIHAATFSFPQPVGTQIPEPPSYQLASIGTYDPETTGALGARSVRHADVGATAAARFPGGQPQAQGRPPGDAPARRRAPPADGTRDLTPGRVKTVSFPKPADADAGDRTAAMPPARAAGVLRRRIAAAAG